MKDRYLEVTFRKGTPLAAYLYLPRNAGVKSARTQEAAAGIRVDYAADGTAIGVEITAPGHVTAPAVNAVLEKLGLAPLTPGELSPIKAA